MLLDLASWAGKKLAPLVKSGAKQTVWLAVGGLGYLYFDQHIGGLRPVVGPSMVPTFNGPLFADQDIVTPNNISSRNNDTVYFKRDFSLSRGDIVYLSNPRGNNFIVKRVLGLPGDTVQPQGVVKGGHKELSPVTLARDQVWVESDAGIGYSDSNLFGPVDINRIQGKGQWAIRPNVSDTNFIGFRYLPSELSEEKLGRVKFA